MDEMEVTLTPELLDSRVKIEGTEIIGKITGIAVYTHCEPQAQIQYIHDGQLHEHWIRLSNCLIERSTMN